MPLVNGSATNWMRVPWRPVVSRLDFGARMTPWLAPRRAAPPVPVQGRLYKLRVQQQEAAHALDRGG